MKKLFVVMSTVLLMLGVGTLRSFGQAPDASTQDEEWNVNGVVNGYSYNGNVPSNVTDNMNGTGSVTIVVTGCTTCYVDTLIDEEVGTPFFNEYATTSGAAGAQTSGGNDWLEAYEAGYLTSSTGQIYTDNANGALTDANSTDGGSGGSNFLNNCVGTCNGDVAIALGAAFTLTSGEEETITVTASTTQPTSGFYIDQTNPQDQLQAPLSGTEVSNVYFTETAVESSVCTANCVVTPPGVTPEPSSWVLLATGVLAFAMVWLRRRFTLQAAGKLVGIGAMFACVLAAMPVARAQTILPVVWEEGSPAAPHTAIAGTNVVLGAVLYNANASHNYTYIWNFGDGSPAVGPTTPINTGAALDLPATHVYAGTTIGQTWTATVTVTDTTTTTQLTPANYLVIWEDGTQLQNRVNVAIDWGLWNLHASMYHPSATTGNWTQSCGPGTAYSCGSGTTSLTSTSVQAFEVNGHTATGTGSSTDPYALDVAQGLDYLFQYITADSSPETATKNYYFDPSTQTFGCSDHTSPTTTNSGSPYYYCTPPATEVQYNPSSTVCPGATTSTPCSYTFHNSTSGYGYYTSTSTGNDAGYEQGMYIDALVASGTPNAVVPTTNLAGTANPTHVAGQTYLNLVQGFVDKIMYCQYGYDYDVSLGYERGSPYEDADQGGGWLYNCNSGDDNSTSQWESIGLISATRAPGFSITVPQIIKDANQVWTTDSEDTISESPAPTGADPYAVGDDYGAFGYRGALALPDGNQWGPFAVTPSGMVQMSLDGVGRTTNTAFGDASTAPDQRFNAVESFYADNFCNTSASAYYAPKAYTYGLFSFTKSMLLHNPGGVLSPIQYLRTTTPGVFTTNSTVPPNSIDWYAAIGPGHSFSSATNPDPCDGVAQTLISRQNIPPSTSLALAGYWYGDNYDGYAEQYETAWSLIMLNKSVFVQCVNNLTGAGTMGNAKTAARVDLAWTGIPNVTGYNVLVSTTNGSGYTQVVYNGGTTTGTAFSDRSGLTNGQTYYFVLQPINSSGAVCQSNQATVTVP
jgi:hypothetical protein